MKFIDLFAGIGGFRLGMEANGHECVAFCEIDKFARASYKAIHNTEGEVEWHDITTVSNEEFRKFRGQVDVICGGFPCQAFSTAGKRLGFEDTRGTLFFEIARATKEIQPQLLFLENVRGLLNHNEGETFRAILSTLDELGYDVEWQLLNSKDFGVSQSRDRVFIIGHSRRGRSRRVFPIRGEGEELSLEGRLNNRIEQPLLSAPSLIQREELRTAIERATQNARKENRIRVMGTTKNPKNKSQGTRERVFDSRHILESLVATDYKGPKQIAIPVLTPDRVEKRQNGRRFKEDGDPMFTLTNQDKHGVLQTGNIGGNSSFNGNSQTTRVYSPIGLSPCLNTMQGGGHEPKIIQRSHGFNKGGEKDLAPSVTSSSYQDNNHIKIYDFYNKKLKDKSEVGTLSAQVGKPPSCGAFGIYQNFTVRKLTPRECWRLQGFPDWAFDKAQEVNSKTQLYKQAGNSVTVNVIKTIAEKFDIL